MVELVANSGDPDQTPRSAGSDLGLNCLPVTHLGVSSLQWANSLSFDYFLFKEDESNPFQIVVLPGEGFHPDADEMRSMTSIDARLKEIMPPEDYQSVAYSSLSHVPKVQSYLVQRFKKKWNY